MRTSSPALRPSTSLNVAVYVFVSPSTERCSVPQMTHVTSSDATAKRLKPISGLR